MRHNDTSRLSRLTAILILLQTKRLITANLIAARFNISTRTAYRDIKALEEAGVPIVIEVGKGYSLIKGYSVPPVMFSEQEANALITAEKLVATNKDASFVKTYTEAITKIKAVLKNNTKEKTDLLSERIQFRNNPKQEITSNYLSEIQVAITHFRTMSIVYNSEKGQLTTRKIEPLALYSTQDNWILIAYCSLRNEKRAFRLDRINFLQWLPDKFTPHNFNLIQYFSECKEKCFLPLT